MKLFVIRAPERGLCVVQAYVPMSVDGAEWWWVVEASGPTQEKAYKYLEDLTALVLSDPEHFL